MESFIIIAFIFAIFSGASSAAGHHADNVKKQEYTYKTYKPRPGNIGTDKPLVDTYETTVTTKKAGE